MSRGERQLESAVPMNKVLVVEHDAELRDAVCAILTGAALSVEGVRSGVEAFDRISRGRFDLVVFDLSLPQLNGFRFWDRFRRLESPPHAIVILGEDVSLDKLRESGLQACRYVSKPVNGRLLIELVHEVLSIDG